MHYDLIILSNSPITNSKLNQVNHKIINENLHLIDNYQLSNGDTFDYIIIENLDALKNIDILIDIDTVICNYYLQTSLDHIFFIGKGNKSILPIAEQIDLILEFLIY